MQVPDDILHNEALNEAIAILPANYNFEVSILCCVPPRSGVQPLLAPSPGLPEGTAQESALSAWQFSMCWQAQATCLMLAWQFADLQDSVAH